MRHYRIKTVPSFYFILYKIPARKSSIISKRDEKEQETSLPRNGVQITPHLQEKSIQKIQNPHKTPEK